MIHAYASQSNYWRHITPIVDELRARGHEVTSWAKRATQPWGGRIRLPAPNDVVIVASEIDARLVIPNPVIYVEHGAGQSYVGHLNLRGFPGGPGLDHVRLFITPGEHVAERWRSRYPNAQVAVVGCPALDGLLVTRTVHASRGPDAAIGGRAENGLRTRGTPAVAITSHWRCGLCPETMPVTSLFERGIVELLGTGVDVIGHAHPRDRVLRTMWDRLGVRFEVDPDVVLREASLLIADNTSLLPEAAAVGIPLVFLNSPRYRREVSHGGRFWEWPEGQVSCDDPADLADAVAAALADPPEVREARARMVRAIYHRVDGRATARAADAIERLGPRP